MKRATCLELHGACDQIIIGETPEAMGENSRKHVMDLVDKGDAAHKSAVDAMMQLTREEQHAWYEEFKKNFDSLPDA